MNRPVPFTALVTLMMLLYAGAANPSSTYLASTACTPAIVFDHVPAYGSSEDLTGHANCITTGDYAVAVYVNVSGWWTKPYFSDPLTPILSDGTWTTDITTGGSDELAADIAAFLVPKSYTPPAMSGEADLPQELYTNAVAYDSVTRHAARMITFSGDTWEVKSTPILSGPGPNYFSDDPANVWVDGNGYLHLKIVQRDGKWYCSEEINTTTAQYGTHTIVTGSPVDLLDKNAILGYFSWDDNAPQFHYREIDIEFSRWSVEDGPNTQYVIQPWEVAGNRHQFSIKLSGPSAKHQFEWRKSQVMFDSWNGDGSRLQSWSYSNTAAIPPAGGNIRLNLWLMDGQPPSDGKDVEVVVKSYQFTPAGIFLPFITHSLRQLPY